MRILSFKWQHIAALLTALVLGLHSLVPAGFMPDFSGQRMLVMCDGHSHYSGNENSGHHNRNDICPFSLATIHSSGDFKALPVLPPVYNVVATTAVFVSSPLIRYTDLSTISPRSPPFFS